MINYTIIIPTKDIPSLLRRCLNSIPNRYDVQIIVIDDNSDPDIVDFDNYPGSDDPRIEIYYNKENKGAGYARNIGLKHAQGKWVLFADSDDFFTEEISLILDEYIDTDFDVIYFKATSVDSVTLEPSIRAIGFNKYVDLYLNKEIDELEIGLNYCVPWGKIIRRSIIDKYALKYSETKASNDVYFATQLSLVSKNIFADNRSLYCITFRHGSLTTTPSVSLLYDRLNERLKSNQLLIQTGHGDRIGSVAYIIYCIYKIAGLKEVVKAVHIVKKSNTSLFTGWRNWLKTIAFLKKNRISGLNY